MTIEQPLRVVAFDEGRDHPPRFLQALEVVQIEALLLQRPDLTLYDAVALRLADVGRRRGDPQPAQLAQEPIRHVLRTPVVPQGEAQGDLRRVARLVLANALQHRLQRCPAIPLLRHVPTHDVFARMVDRTEEPTPAVLPRPEPGRVGPPLIDDN